MEKTKKNTPKNIKVYISKNIDDWIENGRLLKTEVKSFIKSLSGNLGCVHFKKYLLDYCIKNDIPVIDKIVKIDGKSVRAYEFYSYQNSRTTKVKSRCPHCNQYYEK